MTAAGETAVKHWFRCRLLVLTRLVPAIQPLLQAFGGLLRRFPEGELTQYFDVAVASSEIGHAKPDAEAYTITAEKLEVAPEECVLIDDRSEYCDGARAVGMQAIVYEDFVQMKRELAGLLDVA